MKLVCSASFYPLLEDKSRYLVLYGGRGGGKSEFAARKLIMRACLEGGHTFLIMRKINLTIYKSALAVVLAALDEMEIVYTHNKAVQEIVIHGTASGVSSKIMFSGFDNWQKIKSIKGVTGIWLEEATEFTRKDFEEIELVMRDECPHYQQIILSFNPDAALGPWIEQDFFDHPRTNARLHHSTIMDNPIAKVRNEYRRVLEGIHDPVYREIYLYGRWAAAKGIIFKWDVEPLPEGKVDEVIFGGDFGFSVSQAACVKVYRKADHVWLHEVLYETGLTNQQMAQRLLTIEPQMRQVASYWDASEPKSIEELRLAGIRAQPATKGPDSWRAGIEYMKSLYIHVTPESRNLTKESQTYKLKQDRNGEVISPPEPVKYDDHLIDAARYALFTTRRQPRPSIRII